ncbi:hypothetical protein GGS21DRAFT_267194 [Xylaria nigripes]|nr:hypothetical protein GGS21DRAFT_267194 [Xylaria nigripes]
MAPRRPVDADDQTKKTSPDSNASTTIATAAATTGPRPSRRQTRSQSKREHNGVVKRQRLTKKAVEALNKINGTPSNNGNPEEWISHQQQLRRYQPKPRSSSHCPSSMIACTSQTGSPKAASPEPAAPASQEGSWSDEAVCGTGFQFNDEPVLVEEDDILNEDKKN